MFFIGIFGIEDKTKEMGTIHTIVCPACGRYAAAQVLFCYTFFHFFFIPLIKWNKTYLIRLNCCGVVYICDKETADEILATGQIDFGKCRRAGSQGTGDSCPYCGSRVAGNFTYCPFCGNKL
jgi:endogenous inhibitor of DNA gyrase (YacG/DUF329 family)